MAGTETPQKGRSIEGRGVAEGRGVTEKGGSAESCGVTGKQQDGHGGEVQDAKRASTQRSPNAGWRDDGPGQHKAWRESPWWVFAGCCVLSFLGFGIIVNTPGQYFPALRAQFGVGQFEVSATITLQMVIGSLVLLAGGRILEEHDSRLVLALCAGVVACAFIACSFVTRFWQFYVIFAFLGVAYAIPVLLAPQVLLSNWFADRLGLVMGVCLGLSGLSGAIFQPVVALMIRSWGWRGAYLATGLAFAVLTVPCAFLLRFRPDPARGESAYRADRVAQSGEETAVKAGETSAEEGKGAAEGLSARDAFRSWTFPAYVVSMVLLQVASGFVQHVATFEKGRGLAALAAAGVVTGIMLGAAVGKGIIGLLLDRFGVPAVVLSFVAAGMAGWVGVALDAQPGPASLFGFLAGLGQGYLLVAIPWMIRQSYGPAHYGRILARASVFSNLMLALATGLHGVVADATGSFALSFILILVGYALAALLGLLAFARRPFRSRTAAEDR